VEQREELIEDLMTFRNVVVKEGMESPSEENFV